MQEKPQKKIRCAVYCRKSVEDSEEKEFNSIDAQREAGENFIASQKGNGWACLNKRYDDYGFSGGNMNRPALKELIADCKSGLVDIVVVYKVDRLSRSIVDFGELSKDFDKWNVSFVSVTQEINTSTSSGRMMLNILMTFAQYEREVISERIRDKMAASRKRGQWVGGAVPHGYKVVDKHLVVVPEEAKTVCGVFQRFIEIQSPKTIAAELNAAGVKTHSGNRWFRGNIHRMLNNHTYIGEVNYRGHICKGEQDGIVDRAVWDRAHELLKMDDPVKEPKGRVETIAPLKGVLRCGHCGGAMMPTSKKKNGKIYCYYICSADERRDTRVCPVGRIPAGDIEGIVKKQISRILTEPEITAMVAEKAEVPPERIRNFFRTEMWDGMTPPEVNRLIGLLTESVTVFADSLEIEFRNKGLKFIMEDLNNAEL